MAYFNKIILAGNIGAEPEIKLFQNSGKKIALFSLATSRRYRDSNGEQKELTYWHNIKILGKAAETLEKLRLPKGTSMLIEGEMTYNNWTDQQGVKHSKPEVIAVGFQLIGAPRNASNNGTQAQRQNAQSNYGTQSNYAPPPQNEEEWAQAQEDDDLPF